MSSNRDVTGGGLPAEAITNREFNQVRRGYDPIEVKRYLHEIADDLARLRARNDELAAELGQVREDASHPVLTEEAIVAAVGEEMATTLRSAHAAATEMKNRAAGEAERLVTEARARAESVSAEIRARAADVSAAADSKLAKVEAEADGRISAAAAEAEGRIARARREADATVTTARQTATSDAAKIMAKARTDAESVRQQADQERRASVEGAQAIRERILGDLARRRRVATVQIEQLRAGRERLLESYAVVRRTLEEVSEELQRADSDARAAADEAGRRLEADQADGGDDLFDEDSVTGDADAENGSGTVGVGLVDGSAGGDDTERSTSAGAGAPDEGAPDDLGADDGGDGAAEDRGGDDGLDGGDDRRDDEGRRSAGLATPGWANEGWGSDDWADDVPAAGDGSDETQRGDPEAADTAGGDAADDGAASPVEEVDPVSDGGPGSSGGGQGSAPASEGPSAGVDAGSSSVARPGTDGVPDSGDGATPQSGAPVGTGGGALFDGPAPGGGPSAALGSGGAAGTVPMLAGPDRPTAAGRDRVHLVRGGEGTDAAPPVVASARSAAGHLRMLGGGSAALAYDHAEVDPSIPDAEEAQGGLELVATPSDTGPHDRLETLFERIRADRERSVAEARRILDPASSGSDARSRPVAAPPRPTPAGVAIADGTGASVAGPSRPPVDGDSGVHRSDADESELQRRDAQLDEVLAGLTKRMKRALQDEHNDLLDRLRGVRGTPSVADVLGSRDEQAERYTVVARPFVDEAASAGAGFLVASRRRATATAADGEAATTEVGAPVADGGTIASTVEGTTLGDLVAAVVDPLRSRVGAVLAERSGDANEALVDALAAVYREIRSHRLESIVADSVSAAHSESAWRAAPAGVALRWVADDAGGPCPDCDDNTLAGPVTKGEAYPTGQLHPPAHQGCRCLLVLDGE